MHTISQLETSAVTSDSEKKRMEAKIEQGLRVITQKDEELVELRAMKEQEKQSHEVEVNNYKEELEKLKSEIRSQTKKIGEV